MENLRGGVLVPPLDASHVLADNASDMLTGGIDLDWFIAGSEDTLKDRAADEQADIDGVPQNRPPAATPIALALPINSNSSPRAKRRT